VVELLITAAELHIRADLGVVGAAEKRLEQQLAGLKQSLAEDRRTAAAAAGAAAAHATPPEPTDSGSRARSAAS
jgi:hypothetical protein